MDVSILIVSWNVKERLRACLRSVFSQTDVSFEAVVADNDSKDGSAAMVRADFPQVRVIEMGKNAGFAAANVAALQGTNGEFVLLLNPDTEFVGGDALAKMVSCLRANPKAGIMGPRIVGLDGETQASVRRFPTLGSQLLILLKLHHLFRRAPALREYFADGFDYRREATVDQVMGAAMLLRRTMIDQIGFLDERFFIWFEEVDLCKRAVEAGWEVRYAPVATVRHAGGESFSKAFGPVTQGYFNDSLRKYMNKHAGDGAAAAVALLSPVAMAMAWGVHLLRMKRRTYDYRS